MMHQSEDTASEDTASEDTASEDTASEDERILAIEIIIARLWSLVKHLLRWIDSDSSSFLFFPLLSYFLFRSYPKQAIYDIII